MFTFLVQIPRGTVVVWDVGGQERLRALWRSIYYGTGAIIFVVDSADVQRLQLVRDELHSLLKEQELRGVPILVLANKQDAPGAVTAEEIATILELSEITNRPVKIVPTSAANGMGMNSIIEWLGKHLLTAKELGKLAAKAN